MNEFLKLGWRQDDSHLTPVFLPEDVVSDSFVYKSLDKPLKAKIKPTFRLQLNTENYVPCKKLYRLIRRRSLLTKMQKIHCLSAMKLIQSGYKPEMLTAKQAYSLKVYQEEHHKIIEENRLFLEHVQSIWNKIGNKGLNCRSGIYQYSWICWKNKIDRYLYYPQYYKEEMLIGLTYDENEGTIDFRQILNPLEMGTLARFNHPTLKEPCHLRITNLRSIKSSPALNSKLPISQDENVIKLAQNYDFDVSISSSALKQIIDYTSTKTKWLIPVVIKEVQIADNNKKKIVFIDKVLPKTKPTAFDLSVHAYKRLLKLQFCQYEAFKFPVEEAPYEGNTSGSEEISTEVLDECDQITTTTKPSPQESEIFHNVSYRIWKVKKTDHQTTLMKNKRQNEEINLLVRTKLDACEDTDEGMLFPATVRPKVEQQVQFGVNICSKSELARDWTSLFFRIYSNLYRARIYNPLREIVAVEKCSIQKINMEAQTHYNYRPILGLGVLQKVMAELMSLSCGNYLLQHLPKHETFLAVMKECEPRAAASIYDLHAECETTSVDHTFKQNWLPIDVNYILPVHEEFRQIPGVFNGFDRVEQKPFNYKVCDKLQEKT